MATYFTEPSRTFGEYLLVPGYSSSECIPSAVSLKTPLVKYRKGQEDCPHFHEHPAWCPPSCRLCPTTRMAIALAKEGGVSFIYGSQSDRETRRRWSRASKATRPGFVVSDSNMRPDTTLAGYPGAEGKDRPLHRGRDRRRHGQRQAAGHRHQPGLPRQPHGSATAQVAEFMTPFEKLVCAPDEDTTLKEANDIIWDHKINSLPIVDENQHLHMHWCSARITIPTRKTRTSCWTATSATSWARASTPATMQSAFPRWWKRARTCCASIPPRAFPSGRSRTIGWIREKYGDSVKVGAGNVVDREGFRFLAEAGADFVKIGIGGGSICITRETKGIGRGQATRCHRSGQGARRVF